MARKKQKDDELPVPFRAVYGRKGHSGFGWKLRELRLALGWTQEELAEVAGLNTQTIVKIETHHAEPNWPTVLRLAEAVGQTPNYFALRSGEKVPAEYYKPRKRGRPKKDTGGDADA